MFNHILFSGCNYGKNKAKCPNGSMNTSVYYDTDFNRKQFKKLKKKRTEKRAALQVQYEFWKWYDKKCPSINLK